MAGNVTDRDGLGRFREMEKNLTDERKGGTAHFAPYARVFCKGLHCG